MPPPGYERYEGVVSETTEQERRRRQRERSAEVTERAKFLLDNDPDVNDMVTARRKAREQINEAAEHDAQVRKGLVDPETGAPTRKGRKQRSSSSSSSRPQASRQASRRGTSSRSSTRTKRIVRDTARTVTAPFGSAATAGWTLFQGGLSIVLLYVALRDADAISAFARGVSAGIRRIGDPYIPLIPDRVETSPPAPQRRTSSGTRPQARNRQRNAAGGNR